MMLPSPVAYTKVPEVGDDPSTYPQTLADAGCFEGLSVTGEDRARTVQYHGNRAREALRGAATDLNSYLRGLEMRLLWRRFDRVGLQRIVQLINKSNQFNLTTRRHTEADVLAVMDDPDAFGLQLRLLDRFGDNGVVAVAIGRRHGDDVAIDTWLMSCRVLGRQVEAATLTLIAAEARRLGARRLVGEYVPTQKNGMVRDHYAKLGFTVVETDDPGWKELRDDGEPVWREQRMSELLDADGDTTLYVSGCVANQGRFYDRFDAVVLLSAPADVILDRRSGQRDAVAAAQSARRLRLLRLGVLDVLGLVENDAAPVHFLQRLAVAVQKRIARKNQRVLLGVFGESRSFDALRTVIDKDRQLRREAFGLFLPVADDRRGTDKQYRPALARFALALKEGQRLHRLAQPHVVGQAGAQAPLTQKRQPGIAARLIGPQRAHEGGRWRQLRERGASFQLAEEIRDPAFRLDAADFEIARPALRAQGHAHKLAQRRFAAGLLLPEIEGGLYLFGADLHPLAAYTHQRRL